jgi:hypothetical protein
MNLQPIAQGTNHHGGNCVTCHTEPGTKQFTLTNESCRSCHAYESMNTKYHVLSGGAPATCATCHIEPGIPVSTLGIQAVCGQCHGGSSSVTRNGAPYFNLPTLTLSAANIHNAIPTTNFTWKTDATTDYKVLYDASTSLCPAGATCTYTWSSGETGMTASHTFDSSATTTVTLTVTASTGRSSSASKSVMPKYVASTPTAVSITSAPVSGYGVTVNYTLSGGIAPYTVKATWGEGSTETATGVAGGANAAPHSYLNAGTYTVTITATDSGMNGGYVTTSSKTTSVTILPSLVTISGLVTRANGTTPVASASVALRLNGVARKLVYTAADGAFTFTGVAPGAYTVTAAKSGLTFATSPTVTITNVNVTGVAISSTN